MESERSSEERKETVEKDFLSAAAEAGTGGGCVCVLNDDE